jgi:hypothetical protein
LNNTTASNSSKTAVQTTNSTLCPCGHDRNHFMVSREGKYTPMGWFWVTMMGVTTSPIEVSFRCRKCNIIIEKSKKPEDLNSIV